LSGWSWGARRSWWLRRGWFTVD